MYTHILAIAIVQNYNRQATVLSSNGVMCPSCVCDYQKYYSKKGSLLVSFIILSTTFEVNSLVYVA
jgi:hypothetical protein